MHLRPGERVDDLGRGGLRIIQHPGRFPFALDPVLLAHFVRVRPEATLLDLGTGSGIIPLLLAARHPTAHVVGLELQPETAEMAARSVLLNGLDHRLRIDCGDYRSMAQLTPPAQFDVVTLNPPYREPARGRRSPDEAKAIARHELTGTLSDVLAAASYAVKFKGTVAVVFLAERLTDLFTQMRAHRLEPKRMRLVQGKIEQPPKLVLVEAVKGGGVGLTVHPVLVIYGADGRFTAEMRTIYDGDSASA